ncbi:hypothetical protein Bca101_019353 [Brassica carinata]
MDTGDDLEEMKPPECVIALPTSQQRLVNARQDQQQHLCSVIRKRRRKITSAAYPPSQMPQDHLHADRIIEAMIGAGDFSDWASDFLFAVEDQVEIPLSTSVFIPTDFDTADVSSTNGGRRLSVAWWDFQPQNLRKRERRRSKPR